MRTTTAASLCLLSAAGVSAQPSSALKAELQGLLDDLAAATGFGLQLGYVDETGDFGFAAGTTPDGRNITADDTFMFGSGTKPTTAAHMVQLSEQGKLSLDDKAAQYVDPVLKAMNTGGDARLDSMVAMLGAQAADVTVGQLVRMEAGIADFDIPACDDPDLVNGGKGIVQSPMTTFACLVGNYAADKMFACAPGTCTSYSSTNYMLAGMAMTGATVPAGKLAAAGAAAWTLLDQTGVLPAADVATGRFDHFAFMDTGNLTAHLTVTGTTRNPTAKGKETLVGPTQDASILGWTTGNMVASALDVARWYNALLVEGKVVGAAALAKMKTFTPLNEGWAKGSIQYGTGLMIQALGSCKNPPTLDQPGTYVGHGGDAYGALSENGHFPDLNVTISAVANTDLDLSFTHNTFACKVYEIIYKAKFGKEIDIKCRDAPAPGAKYECKSRFGYSMCSPSDSSTLAYADCLISCA